MSRILIVEDHLLVARGLALGLGAEGHEVRETDGEPNDLTEVLEAFDPEIVLLDLHLGALGSGIDLIPLLEAPNRTLVILTSETDASVLGPALEAGAATILDKTMPFPDLIAELESIPRGPSPGARDRNREILHASRLAAEDRERRLAQFRLLTAREEEVLGLLIEGVQAAKIAERTYVSMSTIRSHIRSILAKVGVGSQLAAVSAAIRAGWSPTER